MKNVRFLLFLWLLLHVFITLLVILTTRDLDGQVATHFDFEGNPNDWMSVSGLRWFTIGLSWGCGLFVLAVFFSVKWFPPSMLNVPNKDYWSKPENYPIACRRALDLGIWFSCAVSIFLAAVHILLVRANHLPEPTLSLTDPWMLTFLIGFLAFCTLWSVVLWRRYRVY